MTASNRTTRHRARPQLAPNHHLVPQSKSEAEASVETPEFEISPYKRSSVSLATLEMAQTYVAPALRRDTV